MSDLALMLISAGGVALILFIIAYADVIFKSTKADKATEGALKPKHIVLIVAGCLFLLSLLCIPTGWPEQFYRYNFVFNLSPGVGVYWLVLTFEWVGLAVATAIAFYIAISRESESNNIK